MTQFVSSLACYFFLDKKVVKKSSTDKKVVIIGSFSNCKTRIHPENPANLIS